MLKVGLTGGIGSGKTTVSNFFAELGTPIIDADVSAREVVKPGSMTLMHIREHFGDGVFKPSGELDRRALRRHIFGHPKERRWLEKLLHPPIIKDMQTKLEALAPQPPYVILAIPLLLETEISHPLVDRVLVLDLPEDDQVARVSARDEVDASHVKAIISSQIPREKRLAAADDVIDTAASLSQVKAQVERLHQQYLQLAG